MASDAETKRNAIVRVTERKILNAENARKALAMRRAGMSYEQITRELGFKNKSSAYRLVAGALKAIPKEEAEAVLAIELQRLDVMMVGVWNRAKQGDGDAVDRVLRIMKRRSEYLGLDAPKKNEHSGPGGGPIRTIDLSKLTDAELERLASGDFAPAGEGGDRATPPSEGEGSPQGERK